MGDKMGDITWGDKDQVYLGRNGIGKMEGIHLNTFGGAVNIWPINSKKNLARCHIAIPKEAIPEVIKALQECI